MSKEPNQSMYNKHSIKDAIVIFLILAALAALIYLVKSSNDKSRMDQAQLAEVGNLHQDVKVHSLSELADSLVINEVNQAGWVELYNKERNKDIDLSKCYLTVNGDMKYTFPEGTIIEAETFLCVNGLDRLGNTEHDIIGINDENGDNLKNIMLPSLVSEESYGCRTDGEISYSYMTASKEKTNRESNIINKDKLTFSVPGGFYDESFRLELTAADGMSIYYTLDGSKPTKQSELYKEPILIENKSGSNILYATTVGIEYPHSYRPSSISIGMVVSAIAVDSNGNSDKVVTQSYFVGLKKASDIKNLPVLSIVTDPKNLFDYFSGIYVSGQSHEDALARGEDGGASANYLNGWEKNVNVEYFEPQKDKTYEGKMAISIIKDISVTLPQKSLLLTAEGGAFAGSSLRNYYNGISNRLVVQTNKRDNSYKIRDYLAGRLLTDTTIGTPDITPCIVFINGEYWGGYMLKAEYDEEYIKRRYSVDGDILIAQDGKIIGKWEYQQEFDELYNFIISNDMKDENNYAWVKAHMDIHNYLEYFCANMYLANAEYGMNPLFMWRTINETGQGYEDGRWRFLMSKLDNAMDNGEAGNVATVSINTFLQTGVSEDIFFRSLIRNDEFQSLLKQEMINMAENIFSDEKVDSAIAGISNQLKKMVESSYRRFVGQIGNSYMNETEKIENFFLNREKYILLYTEEVISEGGISNVEDDAVSE